MEFHVNRYSQLVPNGCGVTDGAYSGTDAGGNGGRGFPCVAFNRIKLGGMSKRTATPTKSSETGGYSAITRGSCPAIM